ncbi:Uncharacterized protein BP5553_01778 [Venustampulla echinocandica]|uniref:DUF833-domain-containing protein n=1 Tax=Venustampulla echinocandica TaxID=2656787 RepID=A0A370U1Y6_9HELO|nr:Uncharacterized protein BP5553_01778 [Venustampulla echinocandica]RDL41799.1 Uncharacterized protein BP5553_01778 [Venustampulla echinocandica]
MCIVLATTAHPTYSIIIIDNRDEFILRPTSRPHWWTSNDQQILSSRDLQRAEQGTWLGITRTGNFAVLTNYRETDTQDADHPIQGARSRGGMVTAWLSASEDEGIENFVHRLLDGEGVKGVGGFSLLCGKLRKQKSSDSGLEPLAIISNRAGTPDDVPWIAKRRGEVYGLSNTFYDDPISWPKIEIGKEKMLGVVAEVVEAGMGEEELVDRLFAILDTNTLPQQDGQDFEEYLYELRKSIFIPSIGHAEPPQTIPEADQIATGSPEALSGDGEHLDARLRAAEAPEAGNGGIPGIYGTQRQSIILVDWEGNVSFRERSLWDEEGHPIERGKGDVKFEFKIKDWEGESKGIVVYPRSVL